LAAYPAGKKEQAETGRFTLTRNGKRRAGIPGGEVLPACSGQLRFPFKKKVYPLIAGGGVLKTAAQIIQQFGVPEKKEPVLFKNRAEKQQSFGKGGTGYRQMAVNGGFLRGRKKTGVPRLKFFPDVGQGFAGESAVRAEKKGKRLLPGFRPGDEAEGFIPHIRGLFLEAGQNRRRQGFSPKKKTKKLPRRRFPYQAVGACETVFKEYFRFFGSFSLNRQACVKRSRGIDFCQTRQFSLFGFRGQEKFHVPLFEPFRRLLQAYLPNQFSAAGNKAEDAGKEDKKNRSDLSSRAEYGSWFPK
jgi:hypothetical protein